MQNDFEYEQDCMALLLSPVAYYLHRCVYMERGDTQRGERVGYGIEHIRDFIPHDGANR